MNDPDQNNQPIGDQTPENTPQQTVDQPPVQAESGRKFRITWKFAAGFLGWYLVTALILLVVTGSSTESIALALGNVCIFPIQVMVLILLFLWKKKGREIAWGMLSAIGVNFVISLVLGLVRNATCFIPFFLPVE